jgi:hypothetical protein
MKAFRIVALYLIFSPVALGSSFDPSKTVLQLHELKVLSAEFGTAACLDAQCRYLLSNTHVAVVASPHAIHGDPVVRKLLASGPSDEGAVMNPGGSGTLLYNPSRDIAIYELVKPMKGFQGMPFTLEPLIPGDEVSMIAFPGRTIGVANFSRTLTTWHGSFIGEDQNGCLAFRYTLPDNGGRIRPGTSGGIVVRNGKIVGILRGMSQTELVAEAVPVSSLEIFLAKVNPFLHAQLFPAATVVSPVSFDKFPPWDVAASTPGALERRSAEPTEVQMVRVKAQALYESMKYFMVRQTFSWSDGGSPKMEADYYVTVRNGLELFTSGNHEYTQIPPPTTINGYVIPSALWLNAPRYANGDLSLHIRHAGLTIINGKSIDVYQWQAIGRESKMCQWEEIVSFPLFKRDKTYDVSCYGEIWLSADGDIVRISEAYALPRGHFQHYEAVVVYGRVVLDGESHLVPTTISTHVQAGKSEFYYCDSVFSDYKLWGSQVQLAPGP